MIPSPSRTGREVAEALVRLYDGRRADVRQIAEQAGRLWDMAERARLRVEAEGLLLVGPQGPVRHPAVAIEKDARLAFLSCLRILRQRPPREKLGRRTNEEQVAPDAPPDRRRRYIRPA